MKVERAIYTSARTSRFQGYHLVSRSRGIDDQLAQALCQWSPSHNGLASEHESCSSLNFFFPRREFFGLSRSVYGAPEYSGRRGLQIITMILVARVDDLARYDFHPLNFAAAAMSMGLLHWAGPIAEEADSAWLPDDPIGGWPDEGELPPSQVDDILAQAAARRIAVLGLAHPFPMLKAVFDQCPPHQRINYSFATGLKPTGQRPFRLQFFHTADPSLRQLLANQNILLQPVPASLSSAVSSQCKAETLVF